MARSETGKVVADMVRHDQVSLRAFSDFVQSDECGRLLEEAALHPQGKEATELLRRVTPLIMVAGSRIPFGALKRSTRAVSEIVALYRHTGLPNWFLTVGPDETTSFLVARLACCATEEELGAAAARAPADSASDFGRSGCRVFLRILHPDFVLRWTICPCNRIPSARQQGSRPLSSSASALLRRSRATLRPLHSCARG
jgi:hypothetical protein